jgi:ABC-2 type transport system permease protein
MRGPRNYIFVMAIVLPVLLSLLLSLLFGTFFSDKAKLGLVDEGDSEVPALAAEVDSLIVKEFESSEELRSAVERGAVDIGVVLPADFDQRVATREPSELIAYVWGESALKHRAVLGTTLISLVRDVAGFEPPVEIVSTTLGETQALPWEARLLPLIVLLSMMIGGLMVPAFSMATERQNRTLTALTITPTTLTDVLASKGLLAVILSGAMALVALTLNNAFGGEPLLLIVALILGASMAAMVGLLLGTLAKDVDTLFATIKSLGIVLYAPALIYMFPEIPQWIARLFPTYYIIQPVLEITQEGAGLADVLPELAVLVTLIAAFAVVVGLTAQRKAQAAV